MPRWFVLARGHAARAFSATTATQGASYQHGIAKPKRVDEYQLQLSYEFSKMGGE